MDIFRRALKRREEEVMTIKPPEEDLPVEKKQPTMSRTDFLYGKKDDRRKQGSKSR